MADCNQAVGGDDRSSHDVEVLPADGIVQPEQLMVLRRYLQVPNVPHRSPSLMCDVVDYKHAACIGHVSIIPVMCLRQVGSRL